MLRVLGSRKRFCDGVTRRDLLHVGALAPLGLSLAGLPALADGPGGFGRAKRCILLYLWGSPSQLDTFDPKPDAPPEIRGPLGSIPSIIPGVRVGESLPRIAKILDRVTVLRSLTHPYPIHGTAFALTAVPTTDLPLEGRPRDSRAWPFVGSVVDHLAEKHDPAPPAVPRNFWLPFPFGSKRGPARGGPFGGFLGPAYDPVAADFRAAGTREQPREAPTATSPAVMVADPYLGVRPTDRFDAPAVPAGDLTIDRLNGRASLREQLDAAHRTLDAQSGALDRHTRLAMSVLGAGKLGAALDVQREPPAVRDRYGMTLFGQSCLAARRVLEAGGRFVTVCWDEYGRVNTGWDAHVYLQTRMKDELGPGLDMAFTALLEDLDQRGMLADTAVIVLSEHGRTPRVDKVPGGGRDHWSRAYSAMFAGGGFAAGRVIGRTDKHAGDVVEKPFSPKDVVATVYHLLGIDPQSELTDRLGRPYPVGGIGSVRDDLLA